MKLRRAWHVLGVALLLALARAVPAAASCVSISASGLVFGNYSGSGAVSVTGTITVNCSAGFAYEIGLTGGDTGSTTSRAMTGSPTASQLGYQMYQDAAHSMLWGDSSGVDTSMGTGTGSNQSITIYGVLPAAQNVAPSSYLDHAVAYVVSGPSTSISPMATVPASCAVSAGNLDFGTYSASTAYGTATLTITCTDTTGWAIGLDAGSSPGATVSTRAMRGPSSSSLPYDLFQGSDHMQEWGTTSGTDTVSGTGTGTAHTVTVYGRVLLGMYVVPGSYSDTVTVTVTY